MLFENKKLDEAFAFIAQSEFDVFCLQEVPNEFLDRLQTLPFHFFSVNGWDLIHDPQKGTMTRLHNAILSRLPIVESEAFPLPLWDEVMPLRGRLFKGFLELTRMWPTIHHREDRNGLRADLELPNGKKLRVFCMHLYVANPDWRVQELQTVYKRIDRDIPSIVCGDFNILETFHTTFLNWFMGSSLQDGFVPKSERTKIEREFKKQGLQNPLRGKTTHAFSRSQLDHILVSTELEVIAAYVEKNARGSDHNPVWVEVEVEQPVV